jgi:hypothetical protein
MVHGGSALGPPSARLPSFWRGKSSGDGRTLAVMKVAAGFIGLLVAAFLGLIGLFLILYRGDAAA